MPSTDRAWTRRSLSTVIAVVAGVAIAGGGAHAQADLSTFWTLARSVLHLSDVDVQTMGRGQPVAKTLPSTTKREVSTGGGIRIRGSMDEFVARYRTLEGFRTSQFILQVGTFSNPPRLEDLATLTLDQDDLDALRACRLGDCDLRLSAEDIHRLRATVDWKSPAAATKAVEFYKGALLAYVNAYRAGGLARMVDYAADGQTLRLSAETLALMGIHPSLIDRTPAFADYVIRYPVAKLAGTEDIFYWSKEKFGFKPVIGLNHLSIHRSGHDVVIATTQLYASHYMDGLIAVNLLTLDPGTEGKDFYWLYLNRSRIDRLSGLIGTFARSTVQSRARAGLSRTLLQTRQRMEAVKPR